MSAGSHCLHRQASGTSKDKKFLFVIIAVMTKVKTRMQHLYRLPLNSEISPVTQLAVAPTQLYTTRYRANTSAMRVAFL